jgi:hypothetical protein
VHAGVVLPEPRERRLLGRAARSVRAPERLDRVEVVRIGGAGQPSWRSRPKLGVAGENEHRGEGQPLSAHRRKRRRRRPPLADRGPTDERRIASAEPVTRAPGEHGLRYQRPPFDAALARFAAVLVIITQRSERSCIAGIQLRLPGGEQGDQRLVRRSDDGRSARRACRGLILNEDRCVAPFDPVVGVEDGGLHDRSEPLAGRVWRVRRDERVDEDLVPVENLVWVLFLDTVRGGRPVPRDHRCGA